MGYNKTKKTMKLITIQNDEGLSLSVTKGLPEGLTQDDYTAIMGGMEPTSWDEYLAMYEDEYKPHFLLVKKAIEELEWIGECADKKANDTYFVFSDGWVIGFSWRAWGDLMSAIVGKGEGYMEYYM